MADPVERSIGPAMVIDVGDKAKANPDPRSPSRT
jgi:hypothetical protein